VVNAVTASAAAGGKILVPAIRDSGMDFCITFLHGDRAKRLISLLVSVRRTFLQQSEGISTLIGSKSFTLGSDSPQTMHNPTVGHNESM
jgi:hypothetical protein